MESFESVVALAIESERLVVSEAVKFPLRRPTRKKAFAEMQEHGFEIDLVGARSDLLVLATVKSFFGSSGINAAHVIGDHATHASRYKLLNDKQLRDSIVAAACDRYGYQPEQVRLRLYGGRFAGPTLGDQEQRIREWAAGQFVGGGPIEVFNVQQVMDQVVAVAKSPTYRDKAVLATIKALVEAGYMPR